VWVIIKTIIYSSCVLVIMGILIKETEGSANDGKPKLFGINELDDIIGTIPSNYVILLEGKPGTGKTSLAIRTVCRNIKEVGSRVLYVTSNECVDKLKEVARSIGCDLDSGIAEGKVKVIECPTLGDEYLVEVITEEVMKHVLDGYDMVVIDSVTPLMKILGSYAKKRAWLHTVVYKIASAQNVTVLLVCDTLVKHDPDVALLEYLTDTVIKLEFNPSSVFPRSLRILKHRAKDTPSFPVYFYIASDGIHAINVVSEDFARELRARRKEIIIADEPVGKLLGSKLRPGTQVSIVIRHPATSLGLFHKYLVLKIGLESLRKGIKVGMIYFGKEKGHKLPEEEVVGEVLKDKLIEIPADITRVQAPHYWGSPISDPRLADVLVISGYERLVELYGLDEVNKMLTAYHIIDSKLGLITFRIFRTTPSVPSPPSAMMTLSDIVLEVTLNEERECFNIRVIKSEHALRPVTILDTELRYAVKKLRQEFEKSIRELMSEGVKRSDGQQ